MGAYCTIIPKVRRQDGSLADSILFRNLLTETGNRERAKDIWVKTRHPLFTADFPSLRRDANGEPTLTALKHTGVFEGLDNANLITDEERKAGMRDREGKYVTYPDTAEGHHDALAKAVAYNMTHGSGIHAENPQAGGQFSAVPVETDSGPAVNLVERADDNGIQNAELERENTLYNKLKTVLAQYGIGIGALNSFEDHIRDGVTDFTTAQIGADGLLHVIRLAKGQAGIDALPEEFAHFMIDACADETIVKRLHAAVADEEVQRAIMGDDSYDRYMKAYSNDSGRMAREAAGQLMAMHIRRMQRKEAGTGNGVRRNGVLKRFSDLVSRVWRAMTAFFSKLDESPLERIIRETEAVYGTFIMDTMAGRIITDASAAASKSPLYAIAKEVADTAKKAGAMSEILNEAIENAGKRAKVAERRAREHGRKERGEYSDKAQSLKNELEKLRIKNRLFDGVVLFIKNAASDIENATKALAQIDKTTSMKIKAQRLRNARDFIFSYSTILDHIYAVLKDEEDNDVTSSQNYTETIKLLDSLHLTMRDIRTAYESLAYDTFRDFILPYYTDLGTNPFTGKQYGDFEKLLKEASKDIGFFDRWFRSGANSSDEVINLLDHIIKTVKNSAMDRTIELSHELKAAGRKAVDAGVLGGKLNEQYFEHYADGTRTGRYISQYNWGEFEKAQKEAFARIDASDMSSDDKNREKYGWMRENAVRESIDGKDTIRPGEKYRNHDYDILTGNPAAKEFVELVTEVKKSLDEQLPPDTVKENSIVMIRKDLLQRIAGARSGRDALAAVVRSAGDMVLERGDDTGISYEATLRDFEGKEVEILPIYYTRLRKGESIDDVSDDIVSTLIAYAQMSNEYAGMSEIVDALELGRNVMTDIGTGRRIGQTKGDRPLVEVDKATGEYSQLYRTGGTNFEARLADLYSMHVYGKITKNEGTIGKSRVSVAKTANAWNTVTAINSLALNLTAGITNVVTGNMMMRIEGVAAQFFSLKDIRNADLTYLRSLPAAVAGIGRTIKTDKLSLFAEMFNTMQKFDRDMKDVDFNRMNRALKLLKLDTLYFLNTCGEHYMQNRTALALALSYRMKDADGKKGNLWDALEVKYLDEEHPERGAELKIREGWTKADGTEFGQEDIHAFRLRSAAINHRMHGIYNDSDKSAVQSLSIGRLVLLFRKFIVPSIDRRFRGSHYNYDLGAWEEGFYNTTWQVIRKLYTETREAGITVGMVWSGLSDEQKQNVRRAMTEYGEFIAVLVAIALATPSKDKKRKSRSWLENEAEVLLRREKTEIGPFIPVPPVWMFSESTKLIESPAAAFNQFEMYANVFKLLPGFGSYRDENRLTSGKYKGHTRAHKYLMEMLPMKKTLYKIGHPEESIQYYMKDN